MDARAVILAAGASTRMGGSPKALTDLGGEPALVRIVRACRDAGLPRPVVVVGAHAAAIRDALPALDVEWVVNPDPDAGRTGSLKRGLARLTADAVVVWPVDHPLALGATVRSLVERAARGARLAVPVHAGRRGHPVLLAEGALAEARALADDAPLRDLFRRDPARVVEVAVDDAGVLANLDTPGDVARAPVAAPDHRGGGGGGSSSSHAG